VNGQLILPTTVPIVAIAFTGISYGTIGAIRELLSKFQLRQTFKHYASSPIIQEIISQQDDLQDLLHEREQEVLETTLDGRYKIIRKLSSGGFGETYIAEDTKRPGKPQCVVKQLRPASNSPKVWQLAKRLFVKEAEILERLGKHDQLPQLLAYFEEGSEFYLVEELISGRPLTQELPLVVPLSETKVIAILWELLPVLEFIHSQGVIHRDIKPDNIIRRESDGKLVLIDFGAVKEISAQVAEGEEQSNLTVGIGTKGYMPNEQSAGSPKFNSDIYALGMIAIQGLTATHPSHLPENPRTGEVLWENKAEVSLDLAGILNKMVRYNYRDRYQSATEVLEALEPLIEARQLDFSTSPIRVEDSPKRGSSLKDTPNPTMPWSESSILSDVEDSTMAWSQSETPVEVEDSTMAWSQSETPVEVEDSTMAWSQSETPVEVEDLTMPLTEPVTPAEVEDLTIPLPESSTPQPNSPSSEP
jgi:serine/threonine protein kinase